VWEEQGLEGALYRWRGEGERARKGVGARSVAGVMNARWGSVRRWRKGRGGAWSDCTPARINVCPVVRRGRAGRGEGVRWDGGAATMGEDGAAGGRW
jgi:hypothetical protein